jgi:hypothetical protein
MERELERERSPPQMCTKRFEDEGGEEQKRREN